MAYLVNRPTLQKQKNKKKLGEVKQASAHVCIVLVNKKKSTE